MSGGGVGGRSAEVRQPGTGRKRIGLGRLPGDLEWKRKGVSIHFPIVTSLVLSVVLTVLLNLFLRRK